MTNIALVGCAHVHTPGFVGMLKKRSDVKVAAVWDHDAARAAKNAMELGAPVVADVAAIWADATIPAAVVCSETDRHEQLVPPAAAAGKHLFVEKPLGFAARDALVMADAVERAGVLFQTGYFMRGFSDIQLLKQHIDAGTFGRITRVRHATCHHGSLGGWFDTDWRWMADAKIAGCGGFGDLGTHSLDLLIYLMGEVQSVAAVVDTATRRYGDIDEFGESLIRFKNGVVGLLTASWVDHANPVSCVVTGTRAHAHVLDQKLYLKSEALKLDGKTPVADAPPAWPHAFELFLDAVAGKPNVPLVTVREAAYRSVVMEAMYRAAKERRWVTV